MKYLKYFEQASAYEAYKNGSDFITPNVSYVKETKDISYEPKIEKPTQTYNMVDLGLPSGLLWADRNVGATSPEDAGLYFAWGETVGWTAEQVANGEKAFASDWSDYFDTTDGGSSFNKYATGKLIVLQSEDDAATVNMGLNYRMPTSVNWHELINNTTITYVDIYNNEHDPIIVYGMFNEGELLGVKFTGSNGNSIFIPAGGQAINSSVENYGSDTLLWEPKIIHDSNSNSYNAHYANFNLNGEIMMGTENIRYIGLPVRGVCSK
jgi:hypothetical protein